MYFSSEHIEEIIHGNLSGLKFSLGLKMLDFIQIIFFPESLECFENTSINFYIKKNYQFYLQIKQYFLQVLFTLPYRYGQVL